MPCGLGGKPQHAQAHVNFRVFSATLRNSGSVVQRVIERGYAVTLHGA